MSNPTATKRLALVAEPKIEEGKKLAWLEFVEKAEGGNLKVRAGVPSEFAKTLKVGDKGDAVLETIPGANGRDNWVKLQTWNGQPTEPQRQGFKGGGGGGGFKGPQRTPEQEASIMAQVAAKEASVMYAAMLGARIVHDPKAPFNANEYAQIAAAVAEAIEANFGRMVKVMKQGVGS